MLLPDAASQERRCCLVSFIQLESRWLCLLVVPLLVGCDDRYEYEDEGSVCVSHAHGFYTFGLEVEPPCENDLSTTIEEESTCDVDVVGNDIYIASSISIHAEYEGECSFVGCIQCEDPAVHHLDCDALDLPSGDYTVHHGEEEFSLELHPEMTRDCLGSRSPALE